MQLFKILQYSVNNGGKITYIDNPRKIEDKENEFFVAKKSFLSMGLNPIFLEEGILVDTLLEILSKY